MVSATKGMRLLDFCSERGLSVTGTFTSTHGTSGKRVLTRKQRDGISNDRLYKLTGMEPLEDTIKKYLLRWAGHVRRMDDTRLQKKILFGTVTRGKKSAGKPKKNWVDHFEEDCARTNIPYGSWTEKAKNRTHWQKSISSLTSVKGK
jgi:hypothetical protein